MVPVFGITRCGRRSLLVSYPGKPPSGCRALRLGHTGHAPGPCGPPVPGMCCSVTPLSTPVALSASLLCTLQFLLHLAFLHHASNHAPDTTPSAAHLLLDVVVVLPAVLARATPRGLLRLATVAAARVSMRAELDHDHRCISSSKGFCAIVSNLVEAF